MRAAWVLAAGAPPPHVPGGLMDALQVTILILVAAGATAVVLVREPVRQVIVLSGYGLLLAVLFLTVQAPDTPPTSPAVTQVALVLAGPTLVLGWWLASHAQTSPSGGFQGGVVLATAFILIYLAGKFLAFERFSPADVTDAVEAVGAGGFAAVGVAAVGLGLPFLTNFLGLGSTPGAVSSSGTIALISFFVGMEVAAAFILIVSELLDQTLLVRRGSG